MCPGRPRSFVALKLKSRLLFRSHFGVFEQEGLVSVFVEFDLGLEFGHDSADGDYPARAEAVMFNPFPLMEFTHMHGDEVRVTLLCGS